MKTEFKELDKVTIVSVPVIENNEYANLQIKSYLGKSGYINKIFKHGERNVVVRLDTFSSNYFSADNLTLITHDKVQQG